MNLLLDRGEEAVQVDVQETKPVGMRCAGHSSTTRLYSLFICRWLLLQPAPRETTEGTRLVGSTFAKDRYEIY
jgi:hypothetical protein